VPPIIKEPEEFLLHSQWQPMSLVDQDSLGTPVVLVDVQIPERPVLPMRIGVAALLKLLKNVVIGAIDLDELASPVAIAVEHTATRLTLAAGDIGFFPPLAG
jgi:hypothetical protein